MTDLAAIKAISMLSVETLEMLHGLAARAEHGILEVGPYVGGSTVALALGNEKHLPHVAIEMGGAYLDHPSIPSYDIVADLDANLRRFSVRDRVTIVPGSCYEPDVRMAAFAIVKTIGLLFVDADGRVDATLPGLVDRLAPDSLLAFDDYLSPGAPDKAENTRSTVDQLVTIGAIEAIADPRSTWFGRVRGEEGLKLLRKRDILPEEGFSYIVYGCSGETVFENGRELGPGNSLHADIRALGQGRYSFHPAIDPFLRTSGPALYFSARDNSDPRKNGRVYEVLRAGERIAL